MAHVRDEQETAVSSVRDAVRACIRCDPNRLDNLMRPKIDLVDRPPTVAADVRVPPVRRDRDLHRARLGWECWR